jgi:hypothetical protein
MCGNELHFFITRPVNWFGMSAFMMSALFRLGWTHPMEQTHLMIHRYHSMPSHQAEVVV